MENKTKQAYARAQSFKPGQVLENGKVVKTVTVVPAAHSWFSETKPGQAYSIIRVELQDGTVLRFPSE